MLIDKTNGYLGIVKEFAKKIGKEDNLQENLDYLNGYANDDSPECKHKTQCFLFKDFAPYSFEFVMQAKNKNGEFQRWFNGGLIFHGIHDGFGSGALPTLSVCLNPTDGWSIHT